MQRTVYVQTALRIIYYANTITSLTGSLLEQVQSTSSDDDDASLPHLGRLPKSLELTFLPPRSSPSIKKTGTELKTEAAQHWMRWI